MSSTRDQRWSLDFVVGEVNLNISPLLQLEEEKDQGDQEVTVGDLHGNAIKLLFFLVQEGIFKIDESNYDRLVRCYETYEEKSRKANQLKAQHAQEKALLERFKNLDEKLKKGIGKVNPQSLAEKIAAQARLLSVIEESINDAFKEIARINFIFMQTLLSSCLFNNPVNDQPSKKLVRLVGDELCDRGCSDYFTIIIFLLMFQKESMSENLFKFTVLASNHGLEAVLYCEAVRKFMEKNKDLSPDKVPLEAIKHESILDMDPQLGAACSLQNFI